VKKIFESSPVQQIACGDNFCVVLTQEGKVYSWGLSNNGRLGVRKIVGQ
jgi:alpha-tubulin suppressor-like RCC1 family protein